jgi:hypothetical protein
MRCVALFTLVALLTCGTARGDDLKPDAPQANTPPSEPRVARLVRELGAPEYARRRQADDELKQLGRAGREELQKALTHADVEVRLRAKKLLEKIDLDDLFGSPAVNYQAQSEPASKVLAALAARSGNHIHVGDPYGAFAEKTLDVDYSQMTYWEALDDLCGQTGNRIRPHYDLHTPGIVVSAGAPPKFPRAYGGPVRAQITSARRVFIEELNYEEQKAELTHSFQINLQFTWEDRFRVVGYATGPELVEGVTDNHVIISATQPSASGWNATTRGMRQVTASMKLNPVPVSATKFDVFSIRWGLIAVGDPAVVELADPAAEKTAAQDDLALRVDSIDKQPGAKCLLTLSVMRDLALPDPHEVVFQEYEVELLDAAGRAFRQQSMTPSLSDRGVQLKAAFIGDSPDSEPKVLKLRYPRLRARRDVVLTFRDVPLPIGKPE